MLLLAVVFVMPTGWNAGISLLLLLLLVQSIAIYKLSDWSAAFKSTIVLSSMLYFAFLACSLLWSDDLSEGGRQLETKASFLIAPLLIFAGKRYWQPGLRTRMMKAFWYGTLLAIFIALAYAGYRSIEAGGLSITHEAGTRYFFLYKHLSSPIMHPGYMATYVGLAIFIAIRLSQLSNDMVSKWKYISSIVLFSGIMILLQARINLLALLIVVGIGVLIYAWIQKRYVLFSAPFVGGLLLFLAIIVAPKGISDRYLQLPQFDYNISGEESDFNSATYRLAIWTCAGDVISQQPVIGTGIGDNREALVKSYEENEFWQGVERRFNTHNQYLETLLAVGAVGLLFMLLMFISYLRLAIIQRDFLLLAALGFILISLLTESMFERMWAVILFTVVLPGLAVFHSEERAVSQ
ncbi:MAG: O-antigen ligase family protein [Flavobacteriia bacterium]|nr:O-antigen ligase family protein [Flavobacteriia bacterium]